MATDRRKIREETVEVTLGYHVTEEAPERGTFGNQPLRPDHLHELDIDVYFDDDSPGVPEVLNGRDLQVQLLGTPRALEELGIYLVALARMQSSNPHAHDHFEGLGTANGGAMHLIIQRK